MNRRPFGKGGEYDQIDNDIQPALEQFKYVKDELDISQRSSFDETLHKRRWYHWLFRFFRKRRVAPDSSFENSVVEHSRDRAIANWIRSKHAIIRRLRVSRLMLGAYYHRMLQQENIHERKKKKTNWEKILIKPDDK